MKTHFYLILLILTGILSSGLQCKKEPAPQKLPEITQEGKGTFGCLIDGEVFLPKGHPFKGSPLISEYIPERDALYIDATNYDTHNTIFFKISNFKKNQFYLKDKDSASFNHGVCFFYPNPETENSIRYYTNNYADTGVVNILRFDTTNNIISGTFWFNGRTDQSSDSIKKITEGRFDLKFNY